MIFIWSSAPEQKDARTHQQVGAQSLSKFAPPLPSLDSAVYLPLVRVFCPNIAVGAMSDTPHAIQPFRSMKQNALLLLLVKFGQ